MWLTFENWARVPNTECPTLGSSELLIRASHSSFLDWWTLHYYYYYYYYYFIILVPSWRCSRIGLEPYWPHSPRPSDFLVMVAGLCVPNP